MQEYIEGHFDTAHPAVLWSTAPRRIAVNLAGEAFLPDLTDWQTCLGSRTGPACARPGGALAAFACAAVCGACCRVLSEPCERHSRGCQSHKLIETRCWSLLQHLVRVLKYLLLGY